MLGLRSHEEGDLRVLGDDPARAGIGVRARIGYAPEHHDLPAELSAADFVRHLAEMHLLPSRAAMQRANDALWLGMHSVVSSHHLEEVERICDAVVIVEGGEVVHAGLLVDLRRGPEGVVVGVDERAEELARVLTERGYQVTVADGALLLAPADDVHDAVRDAVAELGIGLRRLGPRGRTLEDVYLGAGL
jgi:ABC-type multidrug transport system ATPase subunit